MMATKLPRLLVTLSAQDVARVEALSASLGLPKSAVMRKALRDLAKLHKL